MPLSARAAAVLGAGHAGPGPRAGGLGGWLHLRRLLAGPLPPRRQRGGAGPARGPGVSPGRGGEPALPPRLRRRLRARAPGGAAAQGPRGGAVQAGHRPVRAALYPSARGGVGRGAPGLSPRGGLPALARGAPLRAARPLPHPQRAAERLRHRSALRRVPGPDGGGAGHQHLHGAGVRGPGRAGPDAGPRHGRRPVRRAGSGAAVADRGPPVGRAARSLRRPALGARRRRAGGRGGRHPRRGRHRPPLRQLDVPAPALRRHPLPAARPSAGGDPPPPRPASGDRWASAPAPPTPCSTSRRRGCWPSTGRRAARTGVQLERTDLGALQRLPRPRPPPVRVRTPRRRRSPRRTARLLVDDLDRTGMLHECWNDEGVGLWPRSGTFVSWNVLGPWLLDHQTYEGPGPLRREYPGQS